MDLPLAVAADAVPDPSTLRVQVWCAARGGRRSELGDRLEDVATDVAAALGGIARVMVMRQIDGDPFPAGNPLCRPFDAVLEVQADHTLGIDVIAGTLAGLGARLDGLVHFDLSAVAAGTVQDIIPCAPLPPLRYLYVMRRRAGTTHAEYVDYYFHSHSRFGPATPAIDGYTQFHVDADASATAAAVVGLPATGADSVSELLLGSLDRFFEGVGDGRLGAAAGADEATFVDRDNSVSFCTTAKVVTA